MKDLITTVIIALVPVIFGWVSHELIKSQKSADSLKALVDLVDAGVVYAEKAGVVSKLTGSEQYQVALNFVTSQLTKLGITEHDEELIRAMIEQSWVKQREELEEAYPDEESKTVPDVSQQLKSNSPVQEVESADKPVSAPAPDSIKPSTKSTSELPQNGGK